MFRDFFAVAVLILCFDLTARPQEPLLPVHWACLFAMVRFIVSGLLVWASLTGQQVSRLQLLCTRRKWPLSPACSHHRYLSRSVRLTRTGVSAKLAGQITGNFPSGQALRDNPYLRPKPLALTRASAENADPCRLKRR